MLWAMYSRFLEDLSHIISFPTWVGETKILLLIYSVLPVPAEYEFSKYHPPHAGTVFSVSCTNPAEHLLKPVIQLTKCYNYIKLLIISKLITKNSQCLCRTTSRMTSHKHMIYSVSSYHINILYQFKVSAKGRCNSTSFCPNHYPVILTGLNTKLPHMWKYMESLRRTWYTVHSHHNSLFYTEVHTLY